MREIRVGIRIDPAEGLQFTGLEAVNGLLNCGGKVVALEPGGAIMRKLPPEQAEPQPTSSPETEAPASGQEEPHVRLTLAGCEIKVLVDDSQVADSPAAREHNRLYEEGADLIRPYLLLTDNQPADAFSARGQQELRQGLDLLGQALAINPANWSAHWICGKAHQSLGDSDAACEAFARAYALEDRNPDVAREYMFECLNLGKVRQGLAAARRAVRLKPEDPGLQANLGLALLIAGELHDAALAVQQSLELAPDDPISQNLDGLVRDVASGRRPQPSSLKELEAD